MIRYLTLEEVLELHLMLRKLSRDFARRLDNRAR
jgi:hypothetical protein